MVKECALLSQRSVHQGGREEVQRVVRKLFVPQVRYLEHPGGQEVAQAVVRSSMNPFLLRLLSQQPYSSLPTLPQV